MPCSKGHDVPVISCPACDVWREEWVAEDQTWKMKNGSTIRFTMTGKPQRFQGSDSPMLYCWICDCAMPDIIWNEHVRAVHEEADDGPE